MPHCSGLEGCAKLRATRGRLHIIEKVTSFSAPRKKPMEAWTLMTDSLPACGAYRTLGGRLQGGHLLDHTGIPQAAHEGRHGTFGNISVHGKTNIPLPHQSPCCVCSTQPKSSLGSSSPTPAIERPLQGNPENLGSV